MYSSALSLTLAQNEGGWSVSRPGRFTPEKTRYPLYRRLGGAEGWLRVRDGHPQVLAALPPGRTRYPLHRRPGGPQGRSGRLRNISPPPGLDPPTVQF
jgi:hypothetical protein